MEPRRVKSGRQGKAVVRGLGTRRIKAELPGIVRRAEEASILTRPGERPFDQSRWQGHAIGDAIATTTTPVQHRRIAGEIVPGRHAIEVAGPARIGDLPRQHAVDGQQVIPLGMGHRADDRQPAGTSRQARQVLAHSDSGHGRIDRLELAADSIRSLGLHVERVVLP